MEWLIVVIVLVVVIAAFVKAPAGKGYRYSRRGPLFTAAERSFLGVLDQAVSDRYRVFGKVRVADLINPTKGMNHKDWQIAFNKISSKHFDYVLCSKDKLEVIAVIELDDKSHSTKKAIKRDTLLESACKSANLKLVRFKATSGYKMHIVRDKIDLVLSSSEEVK
ncbi:MAG: DUF2726 domain-containing protein [Cellvibrionaceae bacterium]